MTAPVKPIKAKEVSEDSDRAFRVLQQLDLEEGDNLCQRYNKQVDRLKPRVGELRKREDFVRLYNAAVAAETPEAKLLALRELVPVMEAIQ